MVDYVAMGKRMKMCRRARNLSQEEMADAVQISISFYGNIERGVRVPSVDTLVAIANVLEVGTDYLLTDSIVLSAPRPSRDESRIIGKFLRDEIAELNYDDAGNKS